MSMYLRVFGIVFGFSAILGLGWALVTGSVYIKGMKEPIRRMERPRDYWFALGIATFIFVVLEWAFLTS
jgi:hypothetical protein